MPEWWKVHREEVFRWALIIVLAAIALLTYQNNRILKQRNVLFQGQREEHRAILSACGGPASPDRK